MKKLVILGASGHGKVIADIALKNEYEEIIFLDDDPARQECAGFKVEGPISNVQQYKDWNVIVAIGNASIRQKIQEQLRGEKYNIATLIHPYAVISRRVEIGIGSVVMAGAVINSDTTIGCGCIVNTCSSVDHDGVIGDFSHVSVGAHVAGTVTIGNRCWIGAGATINNNLMICDDCMIGSGAVVINDIMDKGTYVGVPIRKL